MADKRGDLTGRVAGMVAGVVTRKVMTAAWKKVTGKAPPDNPEDPEVALAEAIGWAAVVGLTISIVRLLATRLVAKRAKGEPAGITEDAKADSASG
jgi:hypothetical protein